MHSQEKQAFLKAFKLVATILLCLLFLPSLLVSLIFFSFFSFFFFLPIISILTSTFLLSAIINRIPAIFIRKELSKDVCDLDHVARSLPDFIEYDCSEIPLLDDQSEEEEGIQEGFDTYWEETNNEFWQIQALNRELNSFYEVLSFWRRKEKGKV